MRGVKKLIGAFVTKSRRGNLYTGFRGDGLLTREGSSNIEHSPVHIVVVYISCVVDIPNLPTV